VLRRDPSRRHHRSPASASSRRGKIPDKQSPQDDDAGGRLRPPCINLGIPTRTDQVVSHIATMKLHAPPRAVLDHADDGARKIKVTQSLKAPMVY
jgi:hypothetical protein